MARDDQRIPKGAKNSPGEYILVLSLGYLEANPAFLINRHKKQKLSLVFLQKVMLEREWCRVLQRDWSQAGTLMTKVGEIDWTRTRAHNTCSIRRGGWEACSFYDKLVYKSKFLSVVGGDFLVFVLSCFISIYYTPRVGRRELGRMFRYPAQTTPHFHLPYGSSWITVSWGHVLIPRTNTSSTTAELCPDLFPITPHKNLHYKFATETPHYQRKKDDCFITISPESHGNLHSFYLSPSPSNVPCISRWLLTKRNMSTSYHHARNISTLPNSCIQSTSLKCLLFQ